MDSVHQSNCSRRHEEAIARQADGDSVPAILRRRLQLANRIVMAPMTRCPSPNGVPGPDEEVIASFGRAAANAQRLGFDGIELYGRTATSSIKWSGFNRRTAITADQCAIEPASEPESSRKCGVKWA
jgi:hypothetical protein